MDSQFFQKKQHFFDRWAPNYDFLLTTIFYQAVHKRMLEFVSLPEFAAILDLGCGTGKLLRRLGREHPHWVRTGVDLSPEMLAQARSQEAESGNLQYFLGNAEALPLPENVFDGVFNTISFLHYQHPEKVLQEIHRVLKPQGRFYLADYAKGDGFRGESFPFSPGGLRFYSRQERQDMGDRASLKCMGHHYLMFGVVLTIFQK